MFSAHIAKYIGMSKYFIETQMHTVNSKTLGKWFAGQNPVWISNVCLYIFSFFVKFVSKYLQDSLHIVKMGNNLINYPKCIQI